MNIDERYARTRGTLGYFDDPLMYAYEAYYLDWDDLPPELEQTIRRKLLGRRTVRTGNELGTRTGNTS